MKLAFTMCPKEHLTRSSFANKAHRKLLFVSIIVVLLPLRLPAQQAQPILFHGVISDTETRQLLTGAHFRIRGKSAGAADSKGMVSFYAHHNDTVIFTCVGYREYHMIISDTLRSQEYVAGIYLTGDTLLIPAVIIIPRMHNIRAEMIAEKPETDQEMINASNNLKISTYQGLTAASRLGDPAANYELLRQKQRVEASEKGGIPSSAMVSVSPLTLIPLIYVLAKGLPEKPEPPAPYISARELNRIRALHDSLIYKGNRQ